MVWLLGLTIGEMTMSWEIATSKCGMALGFGTTLGAIVVRVGGLSMLLCILGV